MPPLAIALALTSALIHATWNTLLKSGQDRIADMALVSAGSAAFGAVLIAIAGLPAAAAWPWLVISGLVHVLYWTCVVKGYDAGDLSHVYTLSRGGAPILVALGGTIAAHEVPAPAEALGIALVSGGVLSVGFSANAPLRASLWAALTACTIASYSLADALGARASHNPTAYVGWMALFTGLPVGLFSVFRRGPLALARAVRKDWLRGTIAGALSAGGFGIVLYAQTFAPIAQVTALRETSVVLAALMAWLLLHERLGARRWIGAGIVAAGAALIALR